MPASPACIGCSGISWARHVPSVGAPNTIERRKKIKRFEVYSHPMFGWTAVKNGFTWPGFFFTGLWMFLCRMWIGGSVVCVLAIASPFIAGALAEALFADEEAALMMTGLIYLGIVFVVCVSIGWKGNAWRRGTLANRGFTHVKSMQAQSADAAVAQTSTEQKTAEAETA